ncbi:YncE family protein [Nocardia sp. NPDC052566]|uniref:YncE family protein n=1 Tax=Nocardia sp. NPDC052566 TaxID=3364330 RepID=UPI0037C74AF4
MRPRGVPSALVGVVTLVLLTGCSTKSDSQNLETRPPATAATAPAEGARPAGDVRPGKQIAALVTEASTGQLAALDPAGTTLTLLDPATFADAAEPRTITLPARAAGLGQGKPGELLVPAPQRVLRIAVATGAITEVPVDGDARSALARDDGSLLVGTADGKIRTLSPEGRVVATISGLASADALVRAEDRVVVLDRRQTSITQLDTSKDRLGLSLRAGEGATSMIGDHFGRVLVTDTAGEELLVYTAGPLVLRQRFPVRSSPYALAYDERSETAWVTCTQSNEVVGFDLSTGIPKEVGRYPTVRQPDSVTIDQRTGDLFVGSATGDGLQRIRAEQRKKGQ